MVNNTHHTLHSGATPNVSVQTATTTTLESIGDLIDHLKQNQQTLNTDTQQVNETITHNHNSDNDNNKDDDNDDDGDGNNNHDDHDHNSAHTNTTTSSTQYKTITKHNRKCLKDRKRKQNSPEECLNPDCFQCAKCNIVNLTDTQLSKAQVILLNKGLSFVPTASNAEPMEIMGDLNRFTIKAKRLLYKTVNPPRPRKTNDEPSLYRKSNQPNPTNTNATNLGPKALEDAFETMRHELANLKPNTTTEHNLNRRERGALKELTSDHNLIINRADKGSTVVVRNRADYVQEGLASSAYQKWLPAPIAYIKVVAVHLPRTGQRHDRPGHHNCKTHLTDYETIGTPVPQNDPILPSPTHTENGGHILPKENTQMPHGHQTDSLHGQLGNSQPSRIPRSLSATHNETTTGLPQRHHTIPSGNR